MTVTARTTPGTPNPRFSAQTVTNRLRDIGEETLYVFYVQRFFFGLVYVNQSSVIEQ